MRIRRRFFLTRVVLLFAIFCTCCLGGQRRRTDARTQERDDDEDGAGAADHSLFSVSELADGGDALWATLSKQSFRTIDLSAKAIQLLASKSSTLLPHPGWLRRARHEQVASMPRCVDHTHLRCHAPSLASKRACILRCAAHTHKQLLRRACLESHFAAPCTTPLLLCNGTWASFDLGTHNCPPLHIRLRTIHHGPFRAEQANPQGRQRSRQAPGSCTACQAAGGSSGPCIQRELREN